MPAGRPGQNIVRAMCNEVLYMFGYTTYIYSNYIAKTR
jgi:hypothetical protein